MIHPTAIIEDGATLGAGCIVHAHAIITRHATLGDGVVVHPFAVIGGDPQDLGFDLSRPSRVVIGARSVLREYVTVNRATKPDGATEVGSDCFLMASSHVAHDCQVGNHVILANAVLLAGHVTIGERAFMGGGAVVHQFGRVGESAMVSGLARMSRDVPPFVMAAERDEVVGLNVVGIRRRGFARATVSELKRAYHEVYTATGNLREQAQAALAAGSYTSAEALRFLAFLEGGRRGFVRRRRGTADAAGDAG
jgi:UDP-N-acetylglucosamine acyltransferase